MNRTNVAILGGSGYTALELIKILLRHPHAEIVAINSREVAPIAKHHPSLHKRLNLECRPYEATELVDLGVEAVFGCLPHGTSMQVIPPLLDHGLRVIDLSADYRLRDPQVYEQWYGEPHHDVRYLEQAVYGLPELYREKIRTATLLANPGCYPQTAILGLAPLLKAGLVPTRGLIVNSLSGVSGAGRTPKLTTHFPECNESVSAYNVGKHRHTPEIEQALSDAAGQPVEVIFTPHLIPMDRGIFSTIYAPLKSPATLTDLQALYHLHYGHEPFVRLRAEPPSTKDILHSNFVDLQVNIVRSQAVILACEDNLTRGASGVAVQNFNLMFGYPESTGLF